MFKGRDCFGNCVSQAVADILTQGWVTKRLWKLRRDAAIAFVGHNSLLSGGGAGGKGQKNFLGELIKLI